MLKVQPADGKWERRWTAIRNKCQQSGEFAAKILDFKKVDAKTVAVLMEYVSGETLADVIDRFRPNQPCSSPPCIPETFKNNLKTFKIVLDNITNLNFKKVRHGDPNPKNILFCKDGKVKFIDLGPSVESPVRLYADVFALLAYSDWYAAFCGVDEYYELVSKRLSDMKKSPGFPLRDFNLLFDEESDEAMYLNYLKQLYLQHGKTVVGTLEILKKHLDKQRTTYLKENSYPTWTYERIWNPDVLRASAQACNEQRLYYSTLDLLLEKLQKIEGVKIKEVLKTYAKSPEAIRNDEKRGVDNRSGVLTVPDRSDPSSNKRATSHLTSVQSTLQTLLQEYDHRDWSRIKKDIIRRVKDLTKPWKDEIIEEIIKDEWKVEVATAFVSFIQEYKKLCDTEDRYKVDLRANDWKWKKLAFANFYVRRYRPLYLDV